MEKWQEHLDALALAAARNDEAGAIEALQDIAFWVAERLDRIAVALERAAAK